MRISTRIISIVYLQRPKQSTKHPSRLASALFLPFLVALSLGSCAPPPTSGASAASAAASTAADRAVLTAARGKRLAVRVTNGCSSDDDCGLGAPAFKTKLDTALSTSGVFAAVSEEKPDFRLNVVMKTLGDQSPISFIDAYEARADFQLADNAGKILSSGSVSGSSSSSNEEALDRMVAQLSARMKP